MGIILGFSIVGLLEQVILCGVTSHSSLTEKA